MISLLLRDSSVEEDDFCRLYSGRVCPIMPMPLPFGGSAALSPAVAALGGGAGGSFGTSIVIGSMVMVVLKLSLVADTLEGEGW